MKKIVLATTALVSVAYAGSALAQESMVMAPQGASAEIGGFYEFGYQSYDDDDQEQDNGSDSGSYSDTELFVSFSRVTDNGLTFGMDVQLESGTIANNGSPSDNNADEASLYIQGDFGRIVLGENDRASDDFQTWAPTHDGTYGQDDGRQYPQFVPDGAFDIEETDDENEFVPATKSYVQAFAGNPSYGDNYKIAYFTPDFSGFRFGVSWEDSQSGTSGDGSYLTSNYSVTDDGDFIPPSEVISNEEADISLGASYSADLNGMDLTINIAASDNGEDDAAERSSIAYGVAVDWHDLSLTVSHAKFEEGEDTGAETTGFGIGYQINDQLSVGGYFANADHDVLNQSADIVSLSAGYTIASGLSATLAWNQFDLSGRNFSGDRVENEGQEAVFQVEVAF